jgi:ribonuclease HII
MRKKFNLSTLPRLPDLSFELDLWNCGVIHVAGVDEAGRGAWAGPVFAAAVILPNNIDLAKILTGVNDSKKLSPTKREFWAERIREQAISWSVGFASSAEIDAIGIVPATRTAMTRSLDGLNVHPGHILIDFLTLPSINTPQTPLVMGDARSLTIAAASILAKTARDHEMIHLSDVYPGYGFEKHKGYGTAYHCQKLNILGPCPVHRVTFKPLLVTGKLTV